MISELRQGATVTKKTKAHPDQMLFDFGADVVKGGDGCKGIATAAECSSTWGSLSASGSERDPTVPADVLEGNAVLEWIRAPLIDYPCARLRMDRREPIDADCDGGQVRDTSDGVLCLWHYARLPKCIECGRPASTSGPGGMVCGDCVNDDYTPEFVRYSGGELSRATSCCDSDAFTKKEIGKIDGWNKKHGVGGVGWSVGNLGFTDKGKKSK